MNLYKIIKHLDVSVSNSNVALGYKDIKIKFKNAISKTHADSIIHIRYSQHQYNNQYYINATADLIKFRNKKAKSNLIHGVC